MITGIQLLYLVRETLVRELERHLDTLYQMRHAELTAIFSAAWSAFLVSLGSLAVVLVKQWKADEMDAVVIAATFVLPLIGIGLYLMMRIRLINLRRECTATTDLVNRLVELNDWRTSR